MTFITDVAKDVRYAVRQLHRTPGFTLIVILSLALGIGANTAIFSAIEALMLRPLPVREPQQLLALEWSAKEFPRRIVQGIEGGGGRSIGPTEFSKEGARVFSTSVYEYVRDHNDVFSNTFAIAGNELIANIGLPGRAEQADAQAVSGNYFEALGVRAHIGRTIEAED